MLSSNMPYFIRRLVHYLSIRIVYVKKMFEEKYNFIELIPLVGIFFRYCYDEYLQTGTN